MWTKAKQGKSDYYPIEVHWSAVPGRDEKWKEETIRNTSEEQFQQEFNVEFLGSSNTLINPAKIQQLISQLEEPLSVANKIKYYEMPQKKRTYTVVVDVSEGLGLDYSTFSIIDVTEIPYKVVAIFRDNGIKPVFLPSIVVSEAIKYNNAFILVEINSIGLQVADMIHYDLMYENLIKIQLKGKQGQQWTPGFTKKISFGLKTSVQTKQIGCTNLKALIESDKIIIKDQQMVEELTTFAADKKTFKAEQGSNDDLVMTLVNFAWLVTQKFFRETVSNDIRLTIQEEQRELVDINLIPFGIIDNGLEEEGEKDADGDLWFGAESYGLSDNGEYDWKYRL